MSFHSCFRQHLYNLCLVSGATLQTTRQSGSILRSSFSLSGYQRSFISSTSKRNHRTSFFLSPKYPSAQFSPRSRLVNRTSMSTLAKDNPPENLGSLLSTVETPALILDLDAFESNCRLMKHFIANFPDGVTCRPHGKAHKCGPLAARQVEVLGPRLCKGVCAQTMAEAEEMVRGGVTDVLLSNQIVTPGKIKRLAQLAKVSQLAVCVDDVDNARALSAELDRVGATLRILVEVNVGQGRCGVDSPEEALALAKVVLELPGLEWGGIQAYHGGIQHVRTHQDRKLESQKVIEKARAVVDTLKEAGISCPTVTGAGTGTFYFEGASGLYTELQPGSWFVGDCDYGRNEGGTEGKPPEWTQALFVASTVISSSEGRQVAVVDAGSKAVSLDSGPPAVQGSEWLQYAGGGDEHGILSFKDPSCKEKMPSVGEVVQLIPGHCDPTVNLHDWVYGRRGDKIEVVYRIGARGPGC